MKQLVHVQTLSDKLNLRRTRWSRCAALALLVGITGCASLPVITPTEPAQIQAPLVLLQLPETPTFAELKLPPLQQQRLGNGIQIVQLPASRAPYVNVSLMIDAGRILFGAEADVLTEMLRLTGSAASPAAWQQQWRALGATLSARSGAHRLIFSAEVLPHQADALFATLRSMWQQANLRDADTLALAQRNLRAQQRQSDLLGGDFVRLWRRLAFGSTHPYGAGVAQRDAVQAVSTDSLQRVWQQAQRERQQWLVAGNLVHVNMPLWQQQLLTEPDVSTHARWRTHTATLPESSDGLRIHLLAADDAAQVNVMIGYVLPLSAQSERWTCEAIAALLGNSSGRLYTDLRERRGLSYDPNSYCAVAPLASELALTGSTRPEHAGAFVHGLLDHLRVLREQVPSTAEMDLLRGALRGDSRMQLEAARQRAQAYNLQEWLGGDWQTLQQQDQFWQQLPAEALPAFSQHHLTAPPIIVVRGKVAELKRQLSTALPHAQLLVHDNADE